MATSPRLLLPALPTLTALLLVSACASASDPGAAPCNAAREVRALVWESDCPGCRHGQQLRLQSGGDALLRLTGKARLRSTDSERSAAAPAAAFDTLLAALQAEGVFTLAPVHDDPSQADGAWTQLTLICSGGQHTLWRRADVGPAALDRIEALLAATRQRLFP